jgi:hypothetical protein
MKPLAVAAAALGFLLLAVPATAQTWSSQPYGAPAYSGQAYGQGYSSNCGSRCDGRHDRNQRRYNSYNGQQDRPGDYRCDAYWDANRTDCNAAWRDQRPWRRTYSSSSRPYRGPAVYPGEYGRPDVVYSGSQYGGHHGHDHSAYGQYGRDPQRIDWCCAEYRSYDPATGYYTAYSGERIFCG